MPQQKEEKLASWFGIAGVSFVVASAAAMSYLYRSYKKDEQKKERARRMKRENRRRKEKNKKVKPIQSKKEYVEKEQGEPGEPGEPGKSGKSGKSGESGESGKSGEPISSQRKKKVAISEEGILAADTEKHGMDEKIGNTTLSPNSPDELSKDALLSILTAMVQGMTMTIQQLAMNPNFNNQRVPDEIMASRLKEQFDTQIADLRTKIFQKHNTDDRHVSASLNKHMHDPEVSQLCVQIERINKALRMEQQPLTEEQLAEIPDSLTVERVIEMMNEMGEKTAEVRKELMAKARLQRNPMQNDELNRQNQQKMIEIQNSIFEKYEASEEIITLAMQKYSSNPKLQKAMMSFQQQQQRQYQEMASMSASG